MAGASPLEDSTGDGTGSIPSASRNARASSPVPSPATAAERCAPRRTPQSHVELATVAVDSAGSWM